MLDINNNDLETLVSSEVHSVKNLVSSNASSLSDCTSLGVSEHQEEKEDVSLNKLADILLDIYITKKKYENNNRQAKASGDLR